jgi:formylglycine-generating enzyme required for sulfatase activity
MEFVKIPAGTFMMGSPANEPDRHPDETQHSVTLTKDFYMSKYQVTNAQYAAFLNSNTIGSDGKGDVSYDKDGSSVVEENQTFIYEHALGVKYESGKWVAQAGYENHPVIGVTWYGAKAYADWVGGSLPTEAQWEYACRGDKGTAPFGVGTDGYKLDYTLGNFNWNYSWSWDGSSATANVGTTGTDYPGTTQRVGSYAANSYGLYDMHGNVWEWCSDWYDNDYSTPPSDDPTGPDTGSDRVFRGGSWGSLAQYCRSAIRNNNYPNYAGIDLGFRVAVVP